VIAPPVGAIGRLMHELGKLPGIGPKSAERLTHFLLAAEAGTVLGLAEALRDIKEKVRPCRQCFNLTEGELCRLCTDPGRDPSVLCVVEQPRDLNSLERAGTYRGLYHVLGGRLAPLENVGPEKLTIDALLVRIHQGGVREVIMATNPTMEGDGTALYLSNLLAGTGVRITRLARGVPSGSVLEFANNQMLADALEGRQVFY
jgi:recombination protein RecR